ncbi:hypothetical protein [Marinobacterium mangrovicola]|uniref:Uncharacterized protein n=1 Tax=Marinobacterium mangrovicola TaxID=1476959 RepID=A0A4R1GP96_9GAMM|nr:hypothetical protein [Marinobacterium mangrovicola]TCK09133.1 hypothetical protein CLV83_1236 [Marinobacterium mangrovicola]
MKKQTLIPLAFVALFVSQESEAQNQFSLVESCGELIGIYKSHTEKRLLAAQTTSLAESLRAGYCIGVLEENARKNRYCRRSWFERASLIAQVKDWNGFSEEELLERSCD